jgi:chemotaxis protein histidine kinase CheA
MRLSQISGALLPVSLLIVVSAWAQSSNPLQGGANCHWGGQCGGSSTSNSTPRPIRVRKTPEQRAEEKAEKARRKQEAKERKDAARERKQEAKAEKESGKRNREALKQARLNAKREAQQKAKQEAQQRALEAARKQALGAEQQQFLRSRPALVSSIKVPAPPSASFLSSPPPSTGSGHSAAPEVPAGVGDQVQAAQAQLSKLLKHQPATAADREQIAALEAKIRSSWEHAADQPNLDAHERSRLAVDLPVANASKQVPYWKAFQPGRLGAFVPALANPDSHTAAGTGEAEYLHPVRLAMAQQVFTDQYGDAIEKLGEGAMEARYGEKGVRGFGTLLPLAKISWAGHKEGAAGAAAETVDFVVGKIPIPSAGFGWSGGKVASAAAKEAFLQFLISVNRGTGKPDYDHDAAEKELERLTTENQSLGVRTIVKVLGW